MYKNSYGIGFFLCILFLLLFIIFIFIPTSEGMSIYLEDIDSGLTSATGDYRWLDIANQSYSNTYQNNYNYTQATVEITYNIIDESFHGTMIASNLKPNFAYQLKLVGNPGTSSNELIGLAGRWWQEEWNGTAWINGQNLNNKGDGSSPNPNDNTYSVRKDIINLTSPTGLKYKYTGYLVFDYFITDEYGNVTFNFDANSSYHVLWTTGQNTSTIDDGPLKIGTFDADLSNAYDDTGGDDYPIQSISIFGEWERLPVGSIYLKSGEYDVQIIITEESFHGMGGSLSGNWAGAMGTSISFSIFDIFVDDDADPGWYDATHVRTIQEGVDNASSGDTVYVFNGTYYENVFVDKTINLTGTDRKNTIIDAGGIDDVINVYADFVNISGFKIMNGGGGPGRDNGVDVNDNYCKIFNNFITSNTDCGILIRSSDNYNIITDNIIISNGQHGICIIDSFSNTIVLNEINFNFLNGILLYGSSYNIISNNTMKLNECGISIYGKSNNNTIQNCVIDSNSYWGIELNATANYTTITECTISNNLEGIYIGNGNYNTIYHNNFINNTIQGFDHLDNMGNFWYNSTFQEGNYWDDFDEPSEGAYDNNSDGIVDTPYNILGSSNQDLHPLIKQYGLMDHKTEVIVSPPSQNVSHGSNFSIDINCTPSQAIRGFQFNLSFNSSILNADDVYNIGEIFTSQGHSVISDYTIDNISGNISYVYATIMGLNNVFLPGRLATINFTANQDIGTSFLNLYNVKIVNLTDYLDFTVYNGTVTIPPNFDINMDGIVDILDISRVSLVFGNTCIPGSIREDIDNNGVIDILDISIVSYHFGESWN